MQSVIIIDHPLNQTKNLCIYSIAPPVYDFSYDTSFNFSPINKRNPDLSYRKREMENSCLIALEAVFGCSMSS